MLRMSKMDDIVSSFKNRWNDLERPYNFPPFFHSWFVKHCHDNVAKCMLQDVHEKAGLGSPPSPYYTNEVEVNLRQLEKKQYKRASQKSVHNR